MAREPAPITAAAAATANNADAPKKKERKPQRPTNPDSKNQKKKARKKANKLAQASWCWYCDREFEDDRILLSHQKAKHFRCPHCPRRLNTAGGLAVHIDQVHKLPVERLDNTLPGRDSFDIEIYGMEGIPKNDLEEWKRKRNTELGLEAAPVTKRPKIVKAVLTIDELAKQLAVHKSLMRQSALRNQQGPPPGPELLRIPGGPMAPPGMGQPSFPMPPGVPMPPPGMFPLPPNIPLPPGFGSPMPGGPVPGAFPPGMPGAPMLRGAPAPFPIAAPMPAPAPYVVQSSRVVQKSGQVHIYSDSDVSYEEKRAKNPKYASTVLSGPSSLPASALAQQPMSLPSSIPHTASAVPAPISLPATQHTPPVSLPAPSQPAAATDDGNPRVTGQKRARAADLI